MNEHRVLDIFVAIMNEAPSRARDAHAFRQTRYGRCSEKG